MAGDARSPGTGEPWLPLGVALLLGVIGFRCLVAISPDPFFDVDPMRNPLPWFGIGPLGVLLTAFLSLVAGSLILYGAHRRGRGLDRVLLLLAVIPLVPVAWHGASGFADLWRGADWIAAAIAGVSLAHAVREPGMRSTVLGGLVGLLAILAVAGGFELLVEHPAMVGYFETNRGTVLAGFGWEPGSVQAELYERRLRQPEATGWFGLANIFSGLMVVGAVLLLGSAMQKLSGGAFGLLLLTLLGMLLLIIVNGSKGAAGAAVLGVLVLYAPAVIRSLRGRDLMLPGALALGALLVTTVAVLVRGGLEADALGGERSLLFRSQYASAAWSMIAAHPWLGVGPASFQEAYLLFKTAESPEDPVSAHAALFDWPATLGVAGCAWIGLLTVLALRCGLAGRTPSEACEHDDPRPCGRLLVPAALLAAGGLALGVELGSLTPVALLFRVVGLLFGIATALLAQEAFQRLEHWKRAWCMAGAAAALLALSALDMLFVQVGSVALAWALLGTFSTARRPAPAAADPLLAGVPLVIAIWVLLVAIRPAWEADRHLEAAVRPLRAIGTLRLDAPAPVAGLAPMSRAAAEERVRATLEPVLETLPTDSPLARAIANAELSACAPGSNDPRLITADLVRRLTPLARRAAVEALVPSVEADPRNFAARLALVEQLRLQAAESPPREARLALLEALVALDLATERGGGARVALTRAWVELESARLEDAPDGERLLAAFDDALTRAPHDPRLWIGRSEAGRLLGRPEVELASLEAALRLDELRGLDPLVQFTPAERAGHERRVEVLGAERLD